MKTKFKFLILLFALFLVFSLGNTKIHAQNLPNTSLSYLQRGQSVKEVQIVLNKLGYNLVTDGIYGKATRSAVLSFQKKHSSLANDGIYGPNTRAIMLKVLSDKDNTKDPVPKPSNTNLPNRSLKYLEKNQDVKNVQIALNKLGYNLVTDGIYGRATKSAVLSFQKGYSSLANDGIYGPNTRAIMLKALAGKDKPKDPVPEPNPRPNSTGIQTRDLVFNIGKSSDQIRFLKDFFRARGASNIAQDYNYDNRTKQLVRDYQKSKGLQVDGIAGNLTLAKMNQEIKDKNYKIWLKTPHINNTGEMILINKSSNTLYFIKNGVIQNSYPVATGKTSLLTPNGRFKVVVKAINPSWGGAGRYAPIAGGAANNPLGKRWIGISYGGGSKYGVHGNSSPNSIGTYASLGCVRMFNKDVEKLYPRVKINTPVWIGNEPLLENYGVKFK